MIENIAIFALVVLSQLNIASADHGSAGFFEQFIQRESAGDEFNLRERNRDYYFGNINQENSLQSLPYKIDGAADFKTEAKAAIAFDAETDAVLYSENSAEQMPIASLTKIMTALVILDNIDFSDAVTISGNAFNTDGRKDGIVLNEKINAKDLFKLMLVSSNNAAAVALAEHTNGNVDNFVELMNEKADLLGLKNTGFSNPVGFDSDENYSTAYDMAQLIDYALDKPLIWEILRMQSLSITSLDGKIKHQVKNTNLLLGRMENITGGKTGLTEEAGQCLALVIGDPIDNHQIISVVLNTEDRFLETEKLVRWVFGSYRW